MLLPAAIIGVRYDIVGVIHPASVRPLSINTYFMCYDISVLSGTISIKLGTDMQRVSGQC